MTDAEFHSYRFNDETEPSDAQLAELMRQAAADAREKGRIAYEKFFDELHKACEDAKQRSKSNRQKAISMGLSYKPILSVVAGPKGSN